MTKKEASMDKQGGSQSTKYFLGDYIEKNGVESLQVDELTTDDLVGLGWSGSASHIEHVGTNLNDERYDYLAVRAPDGIPISKGAIDYSAHEGAGTMTQLSTMPELRGMGIGTLLIHKLEERMRERGLSTSVIGVEVENTGAQKLYERLGYEVFGTEQESWEEKDDEGNPFTYYADVILLRKSLI